MSSFGNKLRNFGYDFNESGKLCKIDENTGSLTDVPFHFEISSSHAKNQANYEALGEVITEYVYDLLERNGLKRYYMSENVPKEETTFIFSTLKELKSTDKLMIIIHGSGVVRAGQFSRSLIINDSLDSGTVLPYIKKAQQEGYEVIITNTNDNFRNGCPIEENSKPEKHAETVWKNFVRKINPKKVAIVAHSYGGCVVTHLAKKFQADFEKKVHAVAFTDSVHSRRNVPKCLEGITVNFITSKTPVNTILSKEDDDVEIRSAGTLKHELTSFSCMEHLFDFIVNERKSE